MMAAKTGSKKEKLQILYQDSCILFAYKPPGFLSQSDHTGDLDMLSMVKDYLKTSGMKSSEPFAGLVHRLDRPASGVMVFAKSPEAAANLHHQFKERKVKKLYLAVVHNQLPVKARWEDFLSKDSESLVSSVCEPGEGKRAILELQTLAFRNNRSLVEIHLLTGISHQIRVQFSSRGFPVVGDRKYGSREVLRNPGMIALCALSLTLTHPISEKTISIRSPRPEHWPWYDPALFNANDS